MKVLLDTNIFLDVFLDRPRLAEKSQEVIDWCGQHPGNVWIAWHTLSNLYYIGQKMTGKDAAFDLMDQLLELFEVAPASRGIANNARSLPMSDFEDALQAAAAQAARVDWIITRNLKDFKSSPVPVLSPEQFVRRFV